MKTILMAMAVVFWTICILLLPACASPNKAPDPVKLQEEIAKYRNQELELVRKTVRDSDRADRLIQLLDERDRLMAGYVKEIGAYREQMSELNADYNADRKSLEMLIANYNSQRAAGQREFLDLIGLMKMETTPEEWRSISRFQLKRLDPRQMTYSQVTVGD